MEPRILIIEAGKAIGSAADDLGTARVVRESDPAAVARSLQQGDRYDLVVCDLTDRMRHGAYTRALRPLMDVEGTTLAIVSDDPAEADAYSDAGVCVFRRSVGNDELRALVDFAVSPG